MLRPRVIPCLLLHAGGLVKTTGFANPRYVGDPINAVRIFNEKSTDELLVLDIDATVEKRPPQFSLIGKLAAECRMPLCYGGGVRSLDEALRIVDLGVEKVAVSSAALEDRNLLPALARELGSQSVVVVLDVRRHLLASTRQWTVYSHRGETPHRWALCEAAQLLVGEGAGEIVVNSIDLDGTMAGYDIDLASTIREAVDVPVTMLGGAASLDDMRRLFETTQVSGAAAGSLFVFKGKFRAVLINYPSPERRDLLSAELLGNPISSISAT